MNLGAEPKKVAILAGLLAVAAISAYINLAPSSPEPARNRRTPATARPASASSGSATTNGPGAPAEGSAGPRGGAVRGARPGGAAGRSGEFRPVFKPERSETRLDPTQVDPALNLAVLAKLRDVRLGGSGRNLFQFGEAPPPPKPPEPKIIPKPLGEDGLPLDAPRPATPIEPVKSPPPPIPLRYYGFADPRQTSDKRAFFMEGEDIRIAAVGELIRERYKVIDIGPRSAVVEDTQHDNRQTLTLQAESGS
ncbi:MAG: hypothetical protein KIT83_05125 [Bryobacterales bacterium]|nr:hypothetical protein [Bryobacterales bacterium]